MKRILLSSAAVVAFAGAAYADGHTGVTFGGDAELGYNNDVDNGMFWSFGLTVGGSMELDNGLTAAISADIDLDDSSSTFTQGAVTTSDMVISLSSDTASLTYGDTAPAADALYSSAVTNMDADNFNDEGDNAEDGVLIGRLTVGTAEVGISYSVMDTNGGADDDLTDLQIGATAALGTVDLSFGYQDSDHANGQVIALGASTTLGGATVGFGYASNDTIDSFGVQVSNTFGQVTGTVFYVAQDGEEDNYGVALNYADGPVTVGVLYHDGADEDLQLNATYDVGNGLNLFAGYRDEGSAANDTYVYFGGDYDLGGGGNLRVSFADADGGVGTATDELGASEDVKDGTTIAVSFAF